ncbi:MAG: branched-chain amino acid aminotransferase [Oscillospiraceae bacterium]|nr:branched-chain amino acid aminotransferase [Oscillospiraceae bacterium]
MNISFTQNPNPKQKPASASELKFGTIFTDHMFVMDYEEGRGWYDPRIVPYAPISLDPATMCLHYAQEVFEGMKAYKSPAGELCLFRPEENFKRLNRSSARICIPPLDVDFCIEAVKELVKADSGWMPEWDDTSLYIRPFIIATDKKLGVHPASHYLFMIILSPVGSYYPEGINPVKIYVEDNYVRAVPGGTGFAKAGGNYAGSLLAQQEAAKKGYAQVLWLDGNSHKYIEEVGAMNVFFVIDNEVVTPALTGSILPGITRMSAIEIMRSWGLKVTERAVTVDEIYDAGANGRLKEMFGTGTAAVISPVGELMHSGRQLVINGGKIGEITMKLYNQLTGIQFGKGQDDLGWSVKI